MARLFIPALSETWITHVEQTSRSQLGLGHVTGPHLSRAIGELSHTYTRDRAELASLQGDDRLLSARLQFFLPRDLLKVHGPLAELHSVSALPKARHWRVLDLGAGLGTTSLGVARFAAMSGSADRLSVTALDLDDEALALFAALAGDLSALPGVPIQLETHVHDLTARALPIAVRGPFELIVLGLAGNELQVALSESEWLARVLGYAQLLADDGCMIILEPALRETSRALQRLRTELAARTAAPYVFAPCLHEAACPMLARERDYCHERVPCTLPPRWAALAASAGLRESDLTYSYLTLHRQRRSLRELADAPDVLLRAVSGQLASKGKSEVWLCRPDTPLRAMRLDRHRSTDNAEFVGLARGSIVRLDASALGPDPEHATALRIGKDTRVRLAQDWLEEPEHSRAGEPDSGTP